MSLLKTVIISRRATQDARALTYALAATSVATRCGYLAVHISVFDLVAPPTLPEHMHSAMNRWITSWVASSDLVLVYNDLPLDERTQQLVQDMAHSGMRIEYHKLGAEMLHELGICSGDTNAPECGSDPHYKRDTEAGS